MNKQKYTAEQKIILYAKERCHVKKYWLLKPFIYYKQESDDEDNFKSPGRLFGQIRAIIIILIRRYKIVNRIKRLEMMLLICGDNVEHKKAIRFFKELNTPNYYPDLIGLIKYFEQCKKTKVFEKLTINIPFDNVYRS